ncbi:Major Facilitator Superfamily protein [Mariniphaga anaerophila]|uniref:Major Facilitator Superfamily protein n=1 Tax=Mariniphaga anaerophila TaxID=1484053 RepID=A0A1M4TAT4_9BACT|nr:MFS transporter [Mariniphaga anaerophila]SHE41367.1 Major Facilitator Superfamily protein [Mariniphaga anaerophila]
MQLKKRWNNFPFSPEKIPFFYGWVILFASTVGVLASAPGQTMGVSTFTDYLIKHIHISRNQISSAYMIGTISSSFLLTWAGKQYDKFGARWTTVTASILLASVLLLLSQSDRIVHLFVQSQDSAIYTGVAIGVMVLLFFLLRFSGQGVLTMVSRNMLMKWFIARRGFANGISSVLITLGFSIAPLTFDGLIQETSWRYAWILMAVGIGVVFMLFAFFFFRDNPEDMGMLPDGEKHGHRERNVTIKPFKQFTLAEARKTLPFWLYALPLAFYSLYITGFTFHLVSIFDQAGLGREKALSIFIPISFMSVGISFFGGWISDRIRLKYLLYIFLTGEIIALFSLANMNGGFYYYGFIVGHGMANGLYSVLMTVTWPRFYGRDNLGRISGFVMSIIVFFSAIGPVLFSFSLTRLGSYSFASYGLAVFILVLAFLSSRGNNPQDKFEIEQSND